VLFYPVTDTSFNTGSYHGFAGGDFLGRGMQWFWDQYTTDDLQRDEITASTLRASVEQLRGLPPALVISGEADVLPSHRRRAAGLLGHDCAARL
jgi:acetyl esterase/lipase